MEVEYAIVYSSKIDHVQLMVNARRREGWRTVGGITFGNTESVDRTSVWAQAMERDIEPSRGLGRYF